MENSQVRGGKTKKKCIRKYLYAFSVRGVTSRKKSSTFPVNLLGCYFGI